MHGLPEAAAGNVADPVEFAVNKQHGLLQPSAVGCGVSVGDVGGVVQVPRVTRTETRHAERFDQSVKVGGWPERGSGGVAGARCAEPNQPPWDVTKADR